MAAIFHSLEPELNNFISYLDKIDSLLVSLKNVQFLYIFFFFKISITRILFQLVFIRPSKAFSACDVRPGYRLFSFDDIRIGARPSQEIV